MDRGELVPDDIVDRRGRGALRRRRSARATASCSTASRARRCRPRSSSGPRRPPARPRGRPRRADRGRARAHRRSAGLRAVRRHLPRRPAAEGRLDVRRVRRPRRAARRRHRGGDRRAGSSSTSWRRVPLIDFYRRLGTARRRSTASASGDEVSRSVWSRRSTSASTPGRVVITRKNARPDRADAARRQGRRRDARGVHPGRRSRARPRSTSTAVAREVLDRRGARSNFLGYHGFPAVICTSPNDVIVHGIPSDDVVLEDGDILSIDCGAIIEGWHADAAITVPIGDDRRRVDSGSSTSRGGRSRRRSTQVVEGNRLGDVGAAVEGIAERGRVHGRARVRRPRHRHRDARGPAGPELRAGRAGA